VGDIVSESTGDFISVRLGDFVGIRTLMVNPKANRAGHLRVRENRRGHQEGGGKC